MESSGVQRLAVMLRTTQQVHKRVDKRLEAWWAEQNAEERTKFLLVSQPGTAASAAVAAAATAAAGCQVLLVPAAAYIGKQG